MQNNRLRQLKIAESKSNMGILSKIGKGQKKREEEQNRKKVEAFIAEYKELSKKHGIDIAPSLNITQTGIVPIVRFIKVEDKK